MYYKLEPEIAGGLGANSRIDTTSDPPKVHHLHYVFDGWLGDELLETFPCFIVTISLGRSLLRASFTGFVTAPVEVSRSEQFLELYPREELPEFSWLQVNGEAGIDDLGLTGEGYLVVSDVAKTVLDSHALSNCGIQGWSK